MYSPIIETAVSPAQCPNFLLSVDRNENPSRNIDSCVYGNRLASHSHNGNVETWCLGRLYYTDDLARRYRVNPLTVGREAEFVSGLIAAAGRCVIEEIEGDFAIAAVDHDSGIVIGCRDAFGGYPLYFQDDKRRVVLGTNSELVSHQTGEQTLSKEFLGRFLTLPMAIYSELLQGGSPFENIQSVMPGQLIEWNMQTGQRTTKYVQGFADGDVDEDAYRSPENFRAAIHHTMVDAVAQRAVGNVCCHSSSGMDSTVVASVTNQLHDRGKISGTCDAITMVYEKDASLRGENEFIDAVHQRFSIPTHRISGDACVNYGPIAAGIQCQHGDPNAFLTRMPIHAALTAKASALGADTILTGAGGDHLFENHPTVQLADDLVSGRLISAYSRSGQQSRVTGASRLQSIRSAVNTVRWDAPTFGRFRMPKRRPWNLKSEYEIADWFAPEFIRDSRICSQMQKGVAADSGRAIPLAWYYKAIFAPAMGDQMRWTLAAPQGIHIAHPYFDRRLCSLILNAPLELRYSYDRDKGLSAATFVQELPRKLIERKSKIGLRNLMTRGYSEHREKLQILVRTAPESLHGIVDRDKVLQGLQLASLGVFQSAIALDRLNLVLALTSWLHTQTSVRREPKSAGGFGRAMENATVAQATR